jgi:hypothetical protein
MKLAEVLNASQFTLLGLLAGVVTYIRNISVKELVTRKGELENEINREIDKFQTQQTSGTELSLDSYKTLKK